MADTIQKEQLETMSLEEALEQLDATLEELQKKDISLEQSFALYQNGMEYVKHCSQVIDQVEKKVLVLNEEGALHELGQ